MKKVLLLNRKYTDNLGDIAIGETLKRLLDSRDFEIYHLEYSTFVYRNIGDFTYNGKDEGSERSKSFLKRIFVKLPKYLRWQMQSGFKLLKSIYSIPFRDIDFIIVGGGQLILSYPFSEQFTYSFNLWYLLNKYFIKSKFILFGVGAGTYYSKTAKRLYKRGLISANKIYVRDYKSKKILEEEFGISALEVPDVAFSFSDVLPLKKKNSNLALVGIYEYEVYNQMDKNNLSYKEYYDYWEKKIEEIEEKGYQVKLFYTTGQDRIETQKFSLFLKNQYEVLQTDTLEDLAKALNSSALVYSARMHALILAKVYGCETLTFPVNDKLSTFKEMYENLNIEDIEELKKIINERLNEALELTN